MGGPYKISCLGPLSEDTPSFLVPERTFPLSHTEGNEDPEVCVEETERRSGTAEFPVSV